MARIDHGKANRVNTWYKSEREAWSGHVPAAVQRASAKQINYLKTLMERHGRRPMTEDEVDRLTLAGASRLIKSFVENI